MENNFIEKVTSLMSALTNEADRSNHDSAHIYTLLNSTVNTISLMLNHIGYLETKLENLEAENQRLSQLSKYYN